MLRQARRTEISRWNRGDPARFPVHMVSNDDLPSLSSECAPATGANVPIGPQAYRLKKSSFAEDQ
jgi:hypothetical protein